MKTTDKKTTDKKTTDKKTAAPTVREAEITAAAAAAPITPPAAESSKQRRERERREWRETQAAARAALSSLGDTTAARDCDATRKKGRKQITPEAHSLLELALSLDSELSQWELKGGATARQLKGAIVPIAAAGTVREKALAAAVNAFLAPLVGFELRLVRFSSPKRGISYFATITIAAR